MDALSRWMIFLLDGRVRSRAHFVSRLALSIAALIFATILVVRRVRPLLAVPAPPRVPDEQPGVRFGLREEERKAIFAEVAAAEPAARSIAASKFPGLPWSIEDDRCWHEAETVHAIAKNRGINPSIVYLVIDEGIRQHWPSPDGTPLKATVEPLTPRRTL